MSEINPPLKCSEKKSGATYCSLQQWRLPLGQVRPCTAALCGTSNRPRSPGTTAAMLALVGDWRAHPAARLRDRARRDSCRRTIWRPRSPEQPPPHATATALARDSSHGACARRRRARPGHRARPCAPLAGVGQTWAVAALALIADVRSTVRSGATHLHHGLPWLLNLRREGREKRAGMEERSSNLTLIYFESREDKNGGGMDKESRTEERSNSPTACRGGNRFRKFSPRSRDGLV